METGRRSGWGTKRKIVDYISLEETNLRKTKLGRNGEPVLSAKSRRDDKPVFEFPEFDREEYIEKEFRDAKVSRMVIVLAFIIAMISYSLVRVNESYRVIGLLMIFMAIAGMRDYFQLIRIDTSAFEKKNWIGNSLLLFFAWFGMFTLFLNPPFYDMVDPKVEAIDLWTVETNETAGNVTFILDESPTLPINTNISINATVVDNSKVETAILTITYPDNSTEIRPMEKTGVKKAEYTGSYLVLSQEGTYTFTVNTEDSSENTGHKTHSIKVQS